MSKDRFLLRHHACSVRTYRGDVDRYRNSSNSTDDSVTKSLFALSFDSPIEIIPSADDLARVRISTI